MNLKKQILENQKRNQGAIQRVLQTDSKLKAEMVLQKNQENKSKKKAKKTKNG